MSRATINAMGYVSHHINATQMSTTAIIGDVAACRDTVNRDGVTSQEIGDAVCETIFALAEKQGLKEQEGFEGMVILTFSLST